MLQPLGHRVLIRPDAQPDSTDSGLVLTQDREYVATAGTVVALGDGSARDAKIRRAVVARCIATVTAMADGYRADTGVQVFADELRDDLKKYADRPARVEGVKVGDHVAFPDEVGSVITWEGERLLILPEDDLVVLEPEEVPA